MFIESWSFRSLQFNIFQYFLFMESEQEELSDAEKFL